MPHRLRATHSPPAIILCCSPRSHASLCIKLSTLPYYSEEVLTPQHGLKAHLIGLLPLCPCSWQPWCPASASLSSHPPFLRYGIPSAAGFHSDISAHTPRARARAHTLTHSHLQDPSPSSGSCSNVQGSCYGH